MGEESSASDSGEDESDSRRGCGVLGLDDSAVGDRDKVGEEGDDGNEPEDGGDDGDGRGDVLGGGGAQAPDGAGKRDVMISLKLKGKVAL